MKVNEALVQARRNRNLTQQELAARLFVTRQAVSRWENGETTPGIDMIKLIAATLDVPAATLLDLPDEPTCQCCGTPFSVPNMSYGTEKDGSENTDYCQWCYSNGEFTSDGLDELIERNVPYLCAGSDMTPDEAVSFLGVVMPTLKRWSQTGNENTSANAARSSLYVCPTCGNVAWSMGGLNMQCCSNTLEPLKAQDPDDEHRACVELSDGCRLVRMDHPMTKQHHIAFIACIGDDLVRIKRLYAEQDAQASFFMQGPCKLYAYCSEHGLFRVG